MVNWVRFGRKQPDRVLQVPRVRLATLTLLCGVLFSTVALSAENSGPWGAMVVVGDEEIASDSQLGVTYALPGRDLRGWWSKIQWHFEGTISQWVGHSGLGDNAHVLGIGLTPVMRVFHGEHWFSEMGIGINEFSQPRVSAQRDVNTHYLFGDFIGVGFEGYTGVPGSLSVRLQHYSNAGIQNPNPGINFWELVYSGSF